jgi:hypothetical protein
MVARNGRRRILSRPCDGETVNVSRHRPPTKGTHLRAAGIDERQLHLKFIELYVNRPVQKY